MSNTVILYHNDLDGIFSAYQFLQKYPNAICQKMDYGVPFDLSLIKDDDYVIMVDFCIQPYSDFIDLLNRINRNMLWIDHHKTSVEFEQEFNLSNIPGIREVGKAACQLCWEYLNLGVEMPYALKAVSQMDVWDKTGELNWDEEVMPFIYGLPRRLELGDILVHDLFDDWASPTEVEGILINGLTNLAEIKKANIELMNRYAFEVDFDGLKFIAINRHGSSIMFESKYDNKIHDGMMCFVRQANNWKFTIYTDKDIDLSMIAKRHLGGGHSGAAGFELEKLPENF